MLLLLTVAVVTFGTVVIVVRSIDDATATTYAFTLHRIGIVVYRKKPKVVQHISPFLCVFFS